MRTIHCVTCHRDVGAGKNIMRGRRSVHAHRCPHGLVCVPPKRSALEHEHCAACAITACARVLGGRLARGDDDFALYGERVGELCRLTNAQAEARDICTGCTRDRRLCDCGECENWRAAEATHGGA